MSFAVGSFVRFRITDLPSGFLSGLVGFCDGVVIYPAVVWLDHGGRSVIVAAPCSRRRSTPKRLCSTRPATSTNFSSKTRATSTSSFRPATSWKSVAEEQQSLAFALADELRSAESPTSLQRLDEEWLLPRTRVRTHRGRSQHRFEVFDTALDAATPLHVTVITE